MTGIDLSDCTQWTRFTEIHYRRQASSSKPTRTETVVMFFPDVWSAMPGKGAYDATCELYAKNLALKLEGEWKLLNKNPIPIHFINITIIIIIHRCSVPYLNGFFGRYFPLHHTKYLANSFDNPNVNNYLCHSCLTFVLT